LPPTKNRRHDEIGYGNKEIRKETENPDTGRIKASLFLGFAECGTDWSMIARVNGATGKCGLTSMRPHVMRPFDDKDV
jgi:hypothetical protein